MGTGPLACWPTSLYSDVNSETEEDTVATATPAKMTELTTVRAVTDAINALVELRHLRGAFGPVKDRPKPAQLRAEAARFADLFEMRADMWRDLAVEGYATDSVPEAYCMACSYAEIKDRDSVKFWRDQAGKR
jgi:hypothetical protein